MNVLYVCREYSPSQRAGGIGSYCKEIAFGMLQRGHNVTILTASDDTRIESDRIEDGIRVIRLSGGDFWVKSAEPGISILKLRSLYRFHSYRRKIRKVVKALSDIDVIEVADFGAEGLYLNDLNIPVITRLHTPSFLDRASVNISKANWKTYIQIIAEKKALKETKYISSCSDCLNVWIRENLGVKPLLSKVILNPVSLDVDKVDNCDNFQNEKRIIFYAGTLVDTKGVGDLVEACKIIMKNHHFNIELLMAGKEGSYAQQLKESLSEEQKKYIKFLGKKKREELFYYYNNADVCCFPSWWENMPMVCLEAMMCKGLVIGSASGGMSEIIEDGVNGYLVPPKSPVQLAECIEKALSLKEEDANRIKQNAKCTIEEKFETSVISKQMEDFYNAVIEDFKIKGNI